jgi:hypothetical protein
VPLAFWLEPATPVEVPVTLVACCSSTSLISMNSLISWPFVISGRTWVDGAGAASSPGCEGRWLSLLGGIVSLVFQV